VIFQLEDDIEDEKFINDLATQNVKISDMGQGKLRMVTHLDYTKVMHDTLLEILNDYSK